MNNHNLEEINYHQRYYLAGRVARLLCENNKTNILDMLHEQVHFVKNDFTHRPSLSCHGLSHTYTDEVKKYLRCTFCLDFSIDGIQD